MKKSTQELVEIMKKQQSYDEYCRLNKDEISDSFVKIDKALSDLLRETNLKKSDVIAKSGLETHYAYQIFSGVRVPTRDKVVMLCFGFGLSVESVQHLLKITGYPPLYVKTGRDNAILFGLTKKISIVEMNNLLYDLNLDILG